MQRTTPSNFAPAYRDPTAGALERAARLEEENRDLRRYVDQLLAARTPAPVAPPRSHRAARVPAMIIPVVAVAMAVGIVGAVAATRHRPAPTVQPSAPIAVDYLPHGAVSSE